MVTSVSFIIAVVESIIILSLRDVISYAFTPGETVANEVSDLCPLLVVTIILNGIQPVLSGTTLILSKYLFYIMSTPEYWDDESMDQKVWLSGADGKLMWHMWTSDAIMLLVSPLDFSLASISTLESRYLL